MTQSEKQKLKKEILGATLKLCNNVSSIIYQRVLHQFSKAIKSPIKLILTFHGKKLKILHQRQHYNGEPYCNNYLKYTVCNVLLYQLSHDEYTTLSFRLDQHIPRKMYCR